MEFTQPTFSLSIFIFQVIWILHSSLSQNVKSGLHDGLREVNVFYFVSHKWGAKVDGDQMCPNMLCNWTTSDDFHRLKTKYDEIMSPEKRIDKQILTAALYNVHDLYAKNSSKFPTNCDWRTNVTLATSEESSVRFRYLFNRIFNNFDGFSTISPQSDIQRVYQDAYLRPSDFVQEMHNFSYLIKAGSYGTSDNLFVM